MIDPVSSIKDRIKAFADYIPRIRDENAAAFEKEVFQRLHRINEMSLACLDHRRGLMKFCFDLCSKELDKSNLFWRTRHKPQGYSGDYLTIDWIYTKKADSPGTGSLWDTMFQRQPAARSVVNRKKFFRDTFAAIRKDAGKSVSVLDLACGPCRDIAEAIVDTGPDADGNHFHCVDADEGAIAYAKDLVESHVPEAPIEWELANAFRVRPTRRYDLVWAAGLFDYLSDRAATFLIKRMWEWAKDEATVIFGNFHPRNPSRNYMEWCLDWLLIHRTEEDMLTLCERAGIPRGSVSFAREPLGVGIFCIATR